MEYLGLAKRVSSFHHERESLRIVLKRFAMNCLTPENVMKHGEEREIRLGDLMKKVAVVYVCLEPWSLRQGFPVLSPPAAAFPDVEMRFVLQENEIVDYFMTGNYSLHVYWLIQ